jgi:hypothetical protein
MRELTRSEVHAKAVEALGLDAMNLDLDTIEALAAAIRRAAGFYCPCSPTTLLRAVLQPLAGLVDDVGAIRETATETLEAVVSYGDLLEQSHISGQPGDRRGLLYAAPPSFVMRQSGAALLIGITPDQSSALPEDLNRRVEHMNHVRRLPAAASDDLRTQLRALGLIELSADRWSKAPPMEAPSRYLDRVDSVLNAAPATSEIPGMTVLDPRRSVRYYRGRWVDGITSTGRFIGRRSQSYGADLWCYIEIESGVPRRFVDLPLPRTGVRGCDEAWRIQAAIDSRLGEPQRFRIRKVPGGWSVLDLFSPVPMWARRRWDSVGEPVASTACLFSYRFGSNEIGEEIKFARDVLWLAELA